MYCFCGWSDDAPLTTGTVAVLRLEADGPPTVADEDDGEEPVLDEDGGARLELDVVPGWEPDDCALER